MRRNRRRRKCRRRETRFNNRKGQKFLPSVKVKFDFEKRIIELLCKIYPIKYMVQEEVGFNHYKKRYGKYFSHVEQRKYKMINFMSTNYKYYGYKGFETAEARKIFNIQKSSNKAKKSKESHANDCWAMNSLIFGNKPIDFNCSFIYWKPNTTIKRQLHVMKNKKGGTRHKQGSTSKNGISKGSYVYSEKFGNCWIQGFRSKNDMCYLMNYDKKRIGEQILHKIKLLYRCNFVFNYL